MRTIALLSIVLCFTLLSSCGEKELDRVKFIGAFLTDDDCVPIPGHITNIDEVSSSDDMVQIDVFGLGFYELLATINGNSISINHNVEDDGLWGNGSIDGDVITIIYDYKKGIIEKEECTVILTRN